MPRLFKGLPIFAQIIPAFFINSSQNTMNKTLFFSLSLLLLFLGKVHSQDRQVQIGCIGFYNFENFFDTLNDPNTKDDDFTPEGEYRYNTPIYLDKIDRLAEVISQIGIDKTPDGLSVFGVAEIENRPSLEDFARHPSIAKRNYKLVHYDSKYNRGMDVALFYNPKYYKVLESQPLFVDLRGDDGKPYYTRDVLWVKGLYLGEELHFLVNHWPSRRGGEERSAPGRAIAARVGRKLIDSLQAANPQAKIILMGDLNDDPVSPSVTEHLRAKGRKKDLKEGDLYNPFWQYYKKGYGTLGYNDAWNLFDQIIISQPLLDKKAGGWYFLEAHIFRKNFLLNDSGRFKGYPKRSFIGNTYNYGYSDHLPTYLYLVREVERKTAAQ